MSGRVFSGRIAEEPTDQRSPMARWIAGLLFLSMLVRVLLLVALPSRDLDDQEEGQIARSLLSGEGYNLIGEPTAHKPVLYTLILVACYAPFPEEWQAIQFDPSIHQKGHLLDQILKILVSGFTVPFIYLLGRKLFSVKVGLQACLFFALNPQIAVQALFPGHMVYDMLVFTWLLLAFLDFPEYPTIRNKLYLGAVSGISLLLNPAVLPFLLGAFGWLFFRVPDRDRWIWKPLNLSLMVVILILLPWTCRNYQAFHRIIPFTSNMPLELWLGNNEQASGGFYRGPSYLSIYPELKELSEPERNAILGAEALNYVKRFPGNALQLRLLSGYYFWFGVWRFGGFPKIISTAWLVFNAFSVLLAWIGLGLALWRRKREAFLPLMLMVGLSLPYILTHGGDDRYRAGLMPVLMILIAYLLSEIASRLLRNHKTRVKVSSNV